VIVYSHTLTPRLHYIIKFLADYFQHPFKLTANELAYTESTDFKINYSHQRMVDGELYINPHILLFETEKRKVTTKCFQQNGYTAFFETSGDVHFDLFAATFYLISRYEEYLPHQKDQYGLFAHQQSVAFKEGFLQQPLVNIWLEDFRRLLKEKFADIDLPDNRFQFLPTYDIDIAWAYKYKGFKTHSGAVLNSVFKGRLGAARERIRVVKGKVQDPYDAYEWMEQLHHQYALHPVYFFLVAEERGKYDRNIDIYVPEFQQLIKHIAGNNTIGVHPSWCSGEHKAQLPKEKKWLETISHQPIHSSRQHYLRFDLPHTFERLLECGIKHEYSMGYGSVNGFRASIATPYNWYDLAKEEATTLLVHPFCFMDAVAKVDEDLTPEQAFDALLYFYTAIKEVNGTMITIWHNHYLGTATEYEGWREVYERFITRVAGVQ
jgi:hypothetical protein